MKRRQIVLLLFVVLAASLLFWMPKAGAESNFFSANCGGCHAASASTCDGCHAHGSHATSAKSNINIAGTLSKTTYAPGETVSVSINGGYKTGWVRAILYDQNMNELARSTGTATGGMGGGAQFPLTLTAPAPAAAGTYTWSVSWYGNKYDKASPFFQATCSPTVTTNCWKPDASNANHGEEIKSIAAFTVSAATTDTTKPVVTFSMPATSSSLTVALTFSATDNVAVTGYMATESATAPLASAGGWTASAPASYTFASAGAKTLYAWAKDAAGNVSLSKSAGVTITLPTTADTTKPVVTFSMPATSSSLTVALTFSATDNVAVTGYMATESATAPLASAAGWTASAPASYTFASAGAKTLYAWAKDAAGNVSLSQVASVTITLPAVVDKRAPRIRVFRVQGRASSLTVPIKAFVAADRVGVTGYQVSESLIADDNNWSATAPTSHTFATPGRKRLFGFVKDGAGNVSRARALVVIKLPEIAAEAVEPAVIDTTVATAAPKQVYSYDPVSSPVRSSDAAEAKPVAIGPIAEGGDKLSLQINIAVPDSTMDAYVTIYSPSETIADPVIVYTLTAGNELVPLTADKKPWRTQVTDINEVILEIPAAELLQGKYLVSFELTPTGTQDTSYLWWTYFIVK